MKKIFSVLTLVTCVALIASAADLPGKKAFIKANLPTGGKMAKMKITVDTDNAAALKESWGVETAESEYEFIIGKDGSGNITGAVYLTTQYVTGHQSVHNIGVALNGDGSLKEMAVLTGSDEWAQKVARKAFLKQFAGKPAAKLTAYKEVLAITGATVSSEKMVEVANSAMGVFALYIKK